MYGFFLFTVRILLRFLLCKDGRRTLLELTHRISRPGAILFVQTLGPAETLIMTPVFRAVKTHFPSSRLYLLGFKEQSAILSGNPYLDGVFTFKNTLLSYGRIFFQIRARKIDLAIVCGTHAFGPLSIALLAHPKWSFCLGPDLSRELPFTRHLSLDPSDDIFSAYRQVAEEMGVEVRDRRLFIVKRGARQRHVKGALEKAGVTGKKPLTGIGMGYGETGPDAMSGNAYTRLLEKFLQEDAMEVVLFGPPESQKRMNRITEGSSGPPPVLVARLDEAFAILEMLDCLFTEDPVLFLAASALQGKGIMLARERGRKGLGAWGREGMVLMKPRETGGEEERLAQDIFIHCERLMAS